MAAQCIVVGVHGGGKPHLIMAKKQTERKKRGWLPRYSAKACPLTYFLQLGPIS
jgi:hypothetical protein